MKKFNKILITGGSGMLGESLKKYFTDAIFWNGKTDGDFTSNEISKKINSLKLFDLIVHCAAYTNIDFCELNPEKAFKLHVDAVKLLQTKCKKFIFISTNPIQSKKVYYKTKLLGESLTLKRKKDLVIRTNIYGDGGLVKWAINKLKINKQINGYENVIFNPLHVDQLSECILKYFNIYSGILNTGSVSVISKYEFLKKVAIQMGLDKELIKPKKINGDLDLTVPIKNQYYTCDLIDGINKL